MKKIFIMAAMVVVAMTSCAQDKKEEAVPATQMTETELVAAVKPLVEKLKALPDTPEAEVTAKEMMFEFVKENKNDAGAFVLTSYLSHMIGVEETLKILDSDPYWNTNGEVKRARTLWEVEAKTSEGKKFVDFQAEYEGKVTKLSDYVGKGKYVLVDFWASWCGPCKREIPNIINVYNKYKGEKFEVLGVATWDKPDDTKKSITELGITYPQMLNAQEAGSSAYGIQGIPEIILFGPDGTILKRGLRGEAIEAAVAECLK